MTVVISAADGFNKPLVKDFDASRHRLLIKRLRFAALALSLFLLICPLPPAIQSDPWMSAAMDGLHVPAFAVLTILVRHLFARKSSLFAVIISILLAGGVEVIQGVTGRSPSWADFGLGVLGTLLIPWGLWLRHRIIAGMGIALPALLFTGLPLFNMSAVRTRLTQDLPRLGFAPERGWSSAWHPHDGSLTKVLVTSSGRTLQVEVSSGSYRGVSFLPGSQDWSAYRQLDVGIWNPGTAFPLGLRIEDQQSGQAHHQRFNGIFVIPPGRSEHSLRLDEIARGPTERRLDLRRIRRLALFTGENEPARTFVLEEAILR
jgi:hypothetical protein